MSSVHRWTTPIAAASLVVLAMLAGSALAGEPLRLQVPESPSEDVQRQPASPSAPEDRAPAAPVPLGPFGPGADTGPTLPGFGPPDERRPAPGADGLARSEPAYGMIKGSSPATGEELWRGAPAALFTTFLPDLPAGLPGHSQRALFDRLMLTEAWAPAALAPARPSGAGQADDPRWVRQQDSGAAEAFLALRIDVLRRSGRAPAAGDLARALADLRLHPLVAEPAARALLADGDLETICLDLRAEGRRMTRQDEAMFWARMRVLCELAAGQRDTAALQAGLLRERGIEDNVFLTLIDALEVPDLVPARIEDLNAFHLMILRLGDLPPPGTLNRLDDPALAPLALSLDRLDRATRLTLLDDAEALASLTPDRLAAQFRALQFSASERGNALERVRGGDIRGPAASALLLQAYDAASARAAKAELLQAMIEGLGPATGSFAEIVADLALALEPSDDIGWMAADVARLFYRLGRADQAQRWMAPASRAAGEQPFLRHAVLEPVAELAAGRLPDVIALDRWIARMQDSFDDGAADRITRGLAALAALGVTTTEAQWLEALGDGRRFRADVPSTAVLFRMDGAAEAGRTGEAGLWALMTLGSGGVALAHSSMLARAIEDLRTVGLGDDARAMAVEALTVAISPDPRG